MIRPLRLALPAAGLAVTATLLASLLPAHASTPSAIPVMPYTAMTGAQRANLMAIARDTWKFYSVDVDSATQLPMDNVTFAGGSATPTSYGRYTSASNIGVYLWAVASARDLGLVSTAQAADRIRATLTEVAHLQRDHGFLYQWYNTSNGAVL
ncbi:MAG: DUF3131 domain-containing protein, partial [Actinobacteria bacterium]|nr:DUF3131 domain-containing protein [Actinomycetota bacterium]